MNPLRTAIERFLGFLEDSKLPYYDRYEFALSLLDHRGLKPDPEEAAELIAGYADHPRISDAGFFLSACYNRSEASNIVYRGIDGVTLDEVGYQLPAGKAFIFERGTAKNIGFFAAAPVLLLGGEAEHVGQASSGPVLQLGGIAKSVGLSAEGSVLQLGGTVEVIGFGAPGPIIQLGGKAGSVGWEAHDTVVQISGKAEMIGTYGPVIRSSCPPALREYLEKLVEPFRRDASHAELFAALRAFPEGREIDATIRRLAADGGHRV